MTERSRSGYAVAAVLGVLTLAVVWLLYPLLGAGIFSVAYVAVTVSAWYGGLGPAIVSIAICGGALLLRFVPAAADPGLQAADWLSLGVFLAVSLVIALMTAARARENRALQASLDQERLVQARILAVMDSVQEALMLVSRDRTVQGVNAHFSELLGLRPEQVVGSKVSELGPLLDQVFAVPEEFVRILDETVSDSETALTAVVVQNRPKPRELELFTAPVCDAGDDASRHLGRLYGLRDITHQRLVDRMKTEFVSLVSHELRTPLTSIKGFTDLILDGDAGEIGEEATEYLEIVQSNADRLVALINDLLDISRIESGRIQLNIQECDLREIVETVSGTLEPQLEAKAQELTIRLEPEASRVRGDCDKLAQVLTNYLSNAHKYTQTGGEIRVEATRKGDFTRVSVSDNGMGIADEDQGQLFTRFYRVDTSLTSDIGGTGLGLSIVKSIVELHGGWVGVSSEPGTGSEFFFTVPLDRSAAQSHAAPEVSKVALPAASDCVVEQRTILVVEDDHDIGLLLRQHLDCAGYLVKTASDMQEALSEVGEDPPDLIALDIHLPENGGYDLAGALAESGDTRDIPILTIAVLRDDRNQVRFETSTLPKPIDKHDLLEEVGHVLEASSRERVLVVEDDASTLELLREVLAKRGFAVLTAQDGEAALDMAGKDRPGLILLDLRLPDMDGFDVLRALKKEASTASIPVITMTGCEGPKGGVRAQVLAMGATDLVTKPFDINTLVEEIRILTEDREA